MTLTPKVRSVSTKSKKKSVGSVAFVGAGPGDPQLMSLRGVDLLREAEVVVVDREASRAAVAAFAPDVEVVDASCGDDGRPLTHAERTNPVVVVGDGDAHVDRMIDGEGDMLDGFGEGVKK